MTAEPGPPPRPSSPPQDEGQDTAPSGAGGGSSNKRALAVLAAMALLIGGVAGGYFLFFDDDGSGTAPAAGGAGSPDDGPVEFGDGSAGEDGSADQDRSAGETRRDDPNGSSRDADDGSPLDNSTPEDAAQSFFAAIGQKDCAGFWGSFEENSANSFESGFASYYGDTGDVRQAACEELFGEFETIDLVEMDVTPAGGDTAQVEATVTLGAAGIAATGVSRATMVQLSDGWAIDADSWTVFEPDVDYGGLGDDGGLGGGDYGGLDEGPGGHEGTDDAGGEPDGVDPGMVELENIMREQDCDDVSSAAVTEWRYAACTVLGDLADGPELDPSDIARPMFDMLEELGEDAEWVSTDVDDLFDRLMAAQYPQFSN